MTISILVEPSQIGFRATTSGPLELSAEAASAAEAVNALHERDAGPPRVKGAQIRDTRFADAADSVEVTSVPTSSSAASAE